MFVLKFLNSGVIYLYIFSKNYIKFNFFFNFFFINFFLKNYLKLFVKKNFFYLSNINFLIYDFIFIDFFVIL